MMNMKTVGIDRDQEQARERERAREDAEGCRELRPVGSLHTLTLATVSLASTQQDRG